MTGRLTVILGPMFAGKSTELMRRVKRELHAKKSCFIVKYQADTRYSHDCMSTHDRLTLNVNASVSKLGDINPADWMSYDVIAIDEGQFFPDIVSFCEKAADMGKTVYVSALDGDFRRHPFGKVLELIPHSNEVVKLTAVCMMCHEEDASFTRRTVQSEETELIGGAEMYIATCRRCFLQKEPPTPGRLNKLQESFRAVESILGKEVLKPVNPNASQDQKRTSIVPQEENTPPAVQADGDEPAAKKARR